MHSESFNSPSSIKNEIGAGFNNPEGKAELEPDRCFSRSDVNSLIENIQEQAENISYEIEKIVGVHNDSESGKLLYQVRWVAYTWIPDECLGSFQHLIKDFLEKENLSHDCTNVTEGNCDNVEKLVDEPSTSIITDSDVIDSNTLEDDDTAGDPTDDDEELVADNYDTESKYTKIEQPNIKNEKFSNNDDIYPLPTAFMVTIDETVDNNVTVHEQPETMNCPKCEQRFFLKSNLEVHTLFCKGIVFEQNAGCRDVEITVNTEEINSSLNSVSKLAVFTEDQTFEYVPIDSNSTNCTTCTQRLPEGAILGDSITDLALLVSHSKKKGCDGEMEIYVCDECEREFLYKYPVKKNNKHQQHRNKTTTLCKKRKIKSEKPYSCSICNRGFLNEQSKNEHEENHASTQSRYSCATCGEKFITRNMLQNHYDSRNECHPTKCDVCSRVFVHSSHLKRHLSIHAGIKPFSCEFCGHEFNQKSDLLRHEKKHTINGTYVCMKCSKAFTDIKILKEHIETHKNEENTKQIFACDRCDKVFGRKSHFKRHMTIHDGIKPYACEKCGKRFNQRTDLKRHMLSHFRREMKVVSCSNSVKKGDDNLICVVCNKVFTDHASFLQHDMQHQKVMSTGVLY